MARDGKAYAVEDFLQALTAQLDRAQDALAIKVKTNRPLTWALKDLSVDLKVFVEIDDRGRVLMRSAGPQEEGASTVHLSLTTVTRPMIEENSWHVESESDPRPLEDLQELSRLDDQDRQKLEWMGVRTIGQLRRLDPQSLQAVAGIPMARLYAARLASARPTVSGHEAIVSDDGETLLEISGANLTDGTRPEVRLAGDAVEVVESRPSRLLVRPLRHHEEGQVEVFTGGERVTGFFRLPETSKRANGHDAYGALDADDRKAAS